MNQIIIEIQYYIIILIVNLYLGLENYYIIKLYFRIREEKKEKFTYKIFLKIKI